jgi:hypothetical protein
MLELSKGFFLLYGYLCVKIQVKLPSITLVDYFPFSGSSWVMIMRKNLR